MIEIGMTESVTGTCTGIVPVFSAKFLIHYREDRLAIIFYSCNLISANFCHMFMLMYAWKKNFIRPHLTVSRYKKALKRIILIILIYLSVIPVSFLSVEISIYLFLIPIIINFLPESCDLNDYKISKNKNRFF